MIEPKAQIAGGNCTAIRLSKSRAERLPATTCAYSGLVCLISVSPERKATNPSGSVVPLKGLEPPTPSLRIVFLSNINGLQRD
ncbi:hypothetical protein [Fuscibacter oryzae]|uniref:Uncharacterized protein n=1 Tax=Fuscibacter oryzae TaxID=2803939 RepID=A0A8J7MRM3_9RHOB|nr:hypothetical protein [Fuscibacter oryzae]MBL4929013.1 hypothetical protein [Fuscibacter oryzae]